MVTASLGVGLKVAMATLKGRSQPNVISIPVGGAKGYHGNTRGRSQALLATVSIWAGLRVSIATLRWAEPIPMEAVPLWAGLRVTMATMKTS